MEYGRDSAYKSQLLATIKTNLQIENDNYFLSEVDSDNLLAKLKELELNSLVKQIDIFNSTFSEGGFQKNDQNIEEEKESKISKNIELKNSVNKWGYCRTLTQNYKCTKQCKYDNNRQ